MNTLRKSFDLMLDIILSSMSKEETILFLSIFKSKLEETLKEMKDQLHV